MTTTFTPKRAAIRPTCSVGLATHATHGLVLTGATLGVPFAFRPTPAFRVRVYDRTLNAITLHGPGSFAISGALAFPASFTATFSADAGVVVSFSTRDSGSGVAFGYSVANSSSRYAVQCVEWPRFELKPWTDDPADFYLVQTFSGGGYTVRRPQDYGAGTWFGTWPGALQFVALFAAETKRILMLRTDDERGRMRAWRCDPNAAADGVVLDILHLADRRYQGANGWTPTYEVHMESFVGKAKDGRLCAYDVALRYREWATAAGRPWVSRGRWWENPNVSPRVKSLDLYVTVSGVDDTSLGVVDADDCTRLGTDLARLKAAVAPAAPAVMLYGWTPRDFNAYWPDPDPFAAGILPAWNSMHTALAAAGWTTGLYAFMKNWSLAIPGGRPFSLFAYSTALTEGVAGNLSLFVLKKRDGTAKTREGGSSATIDWSKAPWRLVFADVLRNCMAGVTTKPPLNYLDGMGPVFPHTLATDLVGADGDYNDADAETAWTWEAYWEGKRVALDEGCAEMRRQNYEWGFSQEYPQEFLIPAGSMTFAQTEWQGALFAPWTVVYGDYQRVADFTLPAVINNNQGQSFSLAQKATISWLNNGVISFNHGVHLSPTVEPGSSAYLVGATYNESPLYFFLEHLKTLRSAHAQFSSYFRGHRTRPAAPTYQGDLIQSGEELIPWLDSFMGGPVREFSESWVRHDGAHGTLLVNVWPNDAAIAGKGASLIAPPSYVPPARTIVFDAELDELPPGPKALYSTVVTGATVGPRTLVATFGLQYLGQVTVPNGSVVLLEVVRAS